MLASYYRRMLTNYVNMQEKEREKLFFKDIYTLVLKAIKKNKQVQLTLSKNYFKNVSIYNVSSSKEELFNYLLIEVNKP